MKRENLSTIQKIIKYVSFPIAIIILILSIIIKDKTWITLGCIFSVVTFIQLLNQKR